MTVEINVGKDFSRYPAGRFPTDGKFNGETFRRKFLLPHFEAGRKIIIYLDDAIDYGSSFLEEAFGGLVRVENISADEILKKIQFVTEDLFLVDEILQYVSEAGE